MNKFRPFHRIFLLTAVAASPLTGLADTPTDIDSLLQCYDQSPKKERVALGQQLLNLYAKEDVEFIPTPELSPTLPKDSLDLIVWYSTERYFTQAALFAKALPYSGRALPLAAKGHPAEHATLLCDRSYCLCKIGDNIQATETCQEAIRISQQYGDLLSLSRAYLYLGIINHTLRLYDEAKDFVCKAIETNDKLGFNEQTHNALGIACEIFCSAGDVDEAIQYGLLAVEAAERLGVPAYVANHLTQLAYTYDRKGEYEQGLESANRAIALVEQMDTPDRNLMALSLNFKAWNLIDLHRNSEAAQALRQAIELEREIGNYNSVRNNYRTLCEALEPLDAREALKAMKMYARMGDSIHSVQLSEAVSKANAEFRNNELQEENARHRRFNRITLLTSLSFILLLIIAIAALWFAFRQKARSNRLLRKLTEARETFFTNITHEFRTPLTVILGMSHELAKNSDSIDRNQLHEASEAIERQGMLLLDLVNQLLDIAKIKSTISEKIYTTDNLTTYVDMLVGNFRELAREKGIDLRFESHPENITTPFVPDYMKKLVSNLLSNAIKFTPQGGNVSLTLQKQGKEVSLTVADTGQGIPQEHLPHVFEPFYQADDTTGIGTGVGLALVKQIVDSLGGTIRVESHPGQGTTFRLALTEASGTEVDEMGNSTTEDGQPTILVVEDNPDVARYIGHLLDGHYLVHYATDGQKGIETARSLVPDLIVTDLMMPNTDGLDLCRAIRQDEVTNHIPLIMVTAKTTDADRLQGLEAGADAYLTKPFNAEELELRVRKLLEQRQQLRKKLERYNSLENPDSLDTPDDLQEEESLEKEGQFSTASQEFIENVHEAVLAGMKSGKTDVEQVASALCMSPSQFRRKLTAITGTLPKQYILDIRLCTARKLLLKYPDRTTADIAEECGFYDQAHFTNVFRKTYGITPRQFQRK